MSESIDIAEGRRLLAAAFRPIDSVSRTEEVFGQINRVAAQTELMHWIEANLAALLDAASELADARQRCSELEGERDKAKKMVDAMEKLSRENAAHFDRQRLVADAAITVLVADDSTARIAGLERQLSECQRERDELRKRLAGIALRMAPTFIGILIAKCQDSSLVGVLAEASKLIHGSTHPGTPGEG